MPVKSGDHEWLIRAPRAAGRDGYLSVLDYFNGTWESGLQCYVT